ncbi:uncharacterized protein C19orf47 homolog isoform X3 [Apteryx mantelli]|uniref:Uncharacterized protein C19orf47 homolog isoform X3 n=1 Tax=Apteryx mantelli TaxID=2696672 RepID=A0ABM4G062_9AVES|nr:PREDICTED: uncharacterized protein C19orf47 homolog isoform X3 [Apteryx mantelli mantelli]
MVSVTMATSEWIQFFKEAGIPPGPAVNYAVMFVDNRIQKNMLMDLNKEIMNELGITIVGDIIAILKHAKVVYRQEMCKAATESICPSPPSVQADLRRNANSGLRDAVDESPTVPVKRRRVTAEMEGKYIINMPKGTTPRTKKILEQQAAKGLQRTSVFDRLGAETKADTTTGGKPTGVFSRLGDTLEVDGDKALESDDDCSVLQYAGVLKKLSKPTHKESAKPVVTIKAKATSSEAKPAATAIRRLGNRSATSIRLAAKERKLEPAASKVSVIQRLGKASLPAEAQDSSITSTKSKTEPEFRVTIKRTWGSAKVSSTSETPSAQMDNTGTVSVFKRLGKKAD